MAFLGCGPHTLTMRRSRLQIPTALVSLALSTGACTSAPSDPAPLEAEIEVGTLAPAFTLRTGDGGSVRSSELIGRKPVLLYFSMGPG